MKNKTKITIFSAIVVLLLIALVTSFVYKHNVEKKEIEKQWRRIKRSIAREEQLYEDVAKKALEEVETEVLIEVGEDAEQAIDKIYEMIENIEQISDDEYLDFTTEKSKLIIFPKLDKTIEISGIIIPYYDNENWKIDYLSEKIFMNYAIDTYVKIWRIFNFQ